MPCAIDFFHIIMRSKRSGLFHVTWRNRSADSGARWTGRTKCSWKVVSGPVKQKLILTGQNKLTRWQILCPHWRSENVSSNWWLICCFAHAEKRNNPAGDKRYHWAKVMISRTESLPEVTRRQLRSRWWSRKITPAARVSCSIQLVLLPWFCSGGCNTRQEGEARVMAPCSQDLSDWAWVEVQPAALQWRMQGSVCRQHGQTCYILATANMNPAMRSVFLLRSPVFSIFLND